MPASRREAIKATEVRHAGIVVTDMKRALGFYRDMLGFKPWREAVETGPFIDAIVGIKGAKLHWIKLKAKNGGMIELLQYLSHPRKARKPVRSNDVGASHIAITVKNVDALCREMRRRGLKINSEPQVSPDGFAKLAYAHDPDGTIVEVVEEL